MRRVCVFLLVLVLVSAGVFAGGSQGGSSGGNAAATSNFNFTGYPMNKLNEKISWADLDGETISTRYGSAAESPYHTNYSKMTGVTIDWVFPTTGTSGAQMYAQLMAGKVQDLPYIINSGGSPDAEQLIKEGVMWDLTPYLEQWAPNYVKFMQKRPERSKAMKTDSGKYWTFGFFREEGPFMDTWVGPIVRKDWLDAQGLPIPKTIADWDRTLQVFKEKYGAMLSFEKTFGDHTGFAGAFGAYAMYNFVTFVKDGKVQAANVQSEYRNYLAKLNEWYTKGYLDPDHLTMDRATFDSKALEGKTGITYGALSRVTGLANNAAAAKNGANWIGIEYPRGPNNTLVSSQGGWGASGMAWITKACPPEKLELVMRFLDYAYSDEGFLFTNFGIKGDTWDYDASGKVVWTPKFLNDIDAPDYQEVAKKYAGMRGSGAGSQATRLVELVNAPISFESAKVWFYPNEEQAYTWRMPPGITLTVDESLRNAELATPINTYVAEMAVSFVTGQVPLSQFDTFVSRLNQMGLAEYLRIQQAAYDRWQKR
ncbi:sugar ABC transporter substrate-binding protein [Spirochaetia bacterium]|nr:sugar ABC transporter substrate-binding protein [Spirochaetia bacterium]